MIKQKLTATALFIAVLCGLFPCSIHAETQNITIDGDMSDWSAIPKYNSSSNDIGEWAVVKDDANLYFYVHELTGDQYDHLTRTLELSYSIGKNIEQTGWGAYEGLVLPGSLTSVKNMNWADIQDSKIAYTADKDKGYDVEFSIPVNYVSGIDPNYSISFAGTTVSDIPTLSDTTKTPDTPNPPEIKPSYSGIQIDGHFKDWLFKDVTTVSDSHIKGVKTL